jgi:hypothetical protein
MAFFPDLCDLHKNITAQAQLFTNGKRRKVDPFGGDILSEISRFCLDASPDDLGNALPRKEAYLPMPAAGVGIAYDPVIRFQDCRFNIAFPDPLDPAD